ncbi:hypothetical protein H0H93_006402 [Arthromyces matolae]|nr:hypothetical protein H0H93_006402 [Arthromyces matolae]
MSDPTPPPPGDNSLDSWEKFEVKAAARDKEVDRQVIDKMLELQQQFASPSKAQDPSPLAGPSPPPGTPVPSAVATAAELSPVPPVSFDVPPAVAVGPDIPGGSLEAASLDTPARRSSSPVVAVVAPPPPPALKKPSVLRKMSSKPDVTEADRNRINAEMEKTGPSRAQLLAAAEGIGSPSEEWWKEHSPCLKCGHNGDCIPHWSKNSKNSVLTSCKLCHIKRVPCSIKINWQISELARLHPEWPRWWIIDREREGWLKKTRGVKVETAAGSSSKIPSKAKGKRKARSEEEEEEDETNSESSSQDADSDPEAVVELAPRPTKRSRLAHEFRPYSKPPGPTPLPGRPLVKPVPSKTSKVREVFVLVPPLTVPQASAPSIPDAVPSKTKVPLFAPSETSEVVVISPPPSKPVPAFVPDPKSPLNIRIPPRPPRLPSPPAGTSLRRTPLASPGLEVRNQVFEGTQFSRGDVLRGRLADARRQSLAFGRGLHHSMASSSAWALQWESIRRECQARGFELSPVNARYLHHAVDDSRRLALDMADLLNEGDCEHMRVVTSGRSVPDQQDLIDEMDQEGMDARWER